MFGLREISAWLYLSVSTPALMPSFSKVTVALLSCLVISSLDLYKKMRKTSAIVMMMMAKPSPISCFCCKALVWLLIFSRGVKTKSLQSSIPKIISEEVTIDSPRFLALRIATMSVLGSCISLKSGTASLFNTVSLVFVLYSKKILWSASTMLWIYRK